MSELSELFDRDPLKLSEQDVLQIIARMREQQSQFELGVRPKAEPKPKTTKGQSLLKDLGFE